MFFAIGGAVLVGASVLTYVLAFHSKPADAQVGLVSSATSRVVASLASETASVASETAPPPVVPTVEPVRTATARTADPVAAKPKETAAAVKSGAPLTRDQRKRLDSLQRLCDQGTFTPAECQAKRSSITNGP
jgi:hypothetical protein